MTFPDAKRAKLLLLLLLLYGAWQVPTSALDLWRRGESWPKDNAGFTRWKTLTLSPGERFAQALGKERLTLYNAIVKHVPEDGDIVFLIRNMLRDRKGLTQLESRYRQPLTSLVHPRRIRLLITEGSRSVAVPADAAPRGTTGIYLIELLSKGEFPGQNQATLLAEAPTFRLWHVGTL